MISNNVGFSTIPPGVKGIIITCVGVFLMQQLDFLNRDLLVYGALWPVQSGNFFPWQLGTYAFLHGSFFHILFNMFVLWMFGQEIENYWGTKDFLIYYAICGVGAAILNLAVVDTLSPTIGASGSIYGVLLAYGMMFPNRIVLFYFLFPIKVKYLVIIYAVVEFIAGVSNTNSQVAHFAHLGGMIFGFLYFKVKDGSLPLRQWIDAMFPPKASTPKATRTSSSKQETRTTNKSQEDQVDAILDKISKNGYESLTKEEKRILLDMSKKGD